MFMNVLKWFATMFFKAIEVGRIFYANLSLKNLFSQFKINLTPLKPFFNKNFHEYATAKSSVPSLPYSSKSLQRIPQLEKFKLKLIHLVVSNFLISSH